MNHSLTNQNTDDYNLDFQSYGDFNFPLEAEDSSTSEAPSAELPFELAYGIMNASLNGNPRNVRFSVTFRELV